MQFESICIFILRIELFNALYRRVLCRQRVNDDQLTVTSLQALAKVYKRYHKEIGKFGDMSYILQLSDRVSLSCLHHNTEMEFLIFTFISSVFRPPYEMLLLISYHVWFWKNPIVAH